MFNHYSQTDRLSLLTKNVIEEKNACFRGVVKVSVENLVFAPDFTRCDHNVSAAKVSRLQRIFRTEGCNRSEPSNFILGTVTQTVLEEAMRLSRLSVQDLENPNAPPMLYLPPFKPIQCANGRSRVSALLNTPHLGTWWTIELYADLSSKTFDSISENYTNEGSFSHGHICERIIYHRNGSKLEEKKWWARLTKSLGTILKSLLKHPTIAPPLLDLILNIPGMREGFEIGTWHKIIGAKCDEEIIQYLEFILESWVGLMGSKEALQFVDTEDVNEFQLRVPGVSTVDYNYLASLIESGAAFKRLSDPAARTNLVQRMTEVKYLLPSIYTLQKDFKYLRQCTETMKRLVYGKKKAPFTVQNLAYDAFSLKQPYGPDTVFSRKLRELYIYIMRDLVELTGEWPLLEDGEESPEVTVRQPENWHRLATEARRLGFDSTEIQRLVTDDPDRQVAFKALQDARPTSFYDYSPSEVQEILGRIVLEFNKARARASTDNQSNFTTIGAGEPLNRRCGRQYSGAYTRDRGSFNFSTFGCDTPSDRDITSLFVRKSVFHAFWRVDNYDDDDMPAQEDVPPISTAEIPPTPAEEPRDTIQVDGEVSQRPKKKAASKSMTRKTIGKNGGVAKSTHARREARSKATKQKQLEGLQRHNQSLEPSPSVDHMQIEQTDLAARQGSTERVPSITVSTMGLVGGPLSPDGNITILEFKNESWTSTTCRRGSIKQFIADAKSRIGGEFAFYTPEGRNFAEHEAEEHTTIYMAPQGTPIPSELWPEEEL